VSKKIHFSSDALALCRSIATKLPSFDLRWKCSTFELAFLTFHFLAIHLALHGFEPGAGTFAWVVMLLSVSLTVGIFQVYKEMPSDLIFSYVLPLVAITSSSLRSTFVSDPSFAHTSASRHLDLMTSVCWLCVPAALAGCEIAFQEVLHQNPGVETLLTKKTAAVVPSSKIAAPVLSAAQYAFAASCLDNHDPNFQPNIIWLNLVSIFFRSFKFSFWVVVGPCVMQTWAPLYYNMTMCYVAFVSVWLSGMTIGLADLLRMRASRIMLALRLQGWWSVCEKEVGGKQNTFETDKWNPAVVYARDSVVYVEKSDGSVSYYKAETLMDDDGSFVFTNPSTLNGFVMRMIAPTPKQSLNGLRTMILSLPIVWSFLLVLCCLSSPFWLWYAALFLPTFAVFYICAFIIVPSDLLLEIFSQ
jgi:hypothetical protein